MKTSINKTIDSYYQKHKNDSIDLLLDEFSDLNVTNEYGGISHAIINYDYDEQWKLRALELLFKKGVDVNLKGKTTGYSYVHLALYGYTDNEDNIFPYKTEFIVNLINLGKKYGLNVNIQDNDGDSIIHTALASEDYEGDIVSLIQALGPNFDLSIKDKKKRGIIDSLDYYIKESQKLKNNQWQARLINDKERLISNKEIVILESSNQSKNAEIKTLVKESSKELDIEKLNKIKDKIASANTLKLIDSVLEDITSDSKIASKIDKELISNLEKKKEILVNFINQIKEAIDGNTLIRSSSFFKKYLSESYKQKDVLPIEYANMNENELKIELENLTKEYCSLKNDILCQTKKIFSENYEMLIELGLDKLFSWEKIIQIQNDAYQDSVISKTKKIRKKIKK